MHWTPARYNTRPSASASASILGPFGTAVGLPTECVSSISETILTNNLVNANTGEFDPRYTYGITNQDSFRWPAVLQGVERELLGLFMTTLFLPGMSLLYYGQERGHYILTSIANNHIYCRQPMTPAPSSMLHGCYGLGSSSYTGFPLDQALHGCEDESVSRDHLHPSHPMRNILKAM